MIFAVRHMQDMVGLVWYSCRNSVCLSIRPSVTCDKMNEHAANVFI